MQLSTLLESLEKIAPLNLAEPWDNVGLLAGDPAQQVSRILLTIDYTPAVADEAIAAGCNLVIAYHPPIFSALKRLSPPNLVFDAVRRGIAIYSPHTALDAADGGTNDVLADAVGLIDRQPLRAGAGKTTHYKLVVFVPQPQLEAVSTALFNAGAGRIGNYTSCSFRIPGTGTFFAEQGAQPAVGQVGRLEQAPEIRVETVVPITCLDAVIRALRKSHPYEEPAFDLNVLAVAPQLSGMGRVGNLPPTPRSEILQRIKQDLDVTRLLVAGPLEGSITRAAVSAGSAGDMLDDALAAGAQLYLTGEMRHHDALKAAARGVTVVCTLHSNSERAVLPRYKRKLEDILVAGPAGELPQIIISSRDRDPFEIL